MDSPRLLTVDEAAATLRCSSRAVWRLISDGTLVRGPCFGRRTVVLAESVYAACERAFEPPVEKPKRVRRSSRAETNDAFDALLAEVRRS